LIIARNNVDEETAEGGEGDDGGIYIEVNERENWCQQGCPYRAAPRTLCPRALALK
jgi:hypothetical protein